MLGTRVLYYKDGGFILSAKENFQDYSVDNVLWVEVTHLGHVIRMGGMDNFWVDGLECGMFNDAENKDWYDGYQAVRWIWKHDEEGQDVSFDYPGHADVHILHGVMVPDDVWEEARRVE